MQYRRFGRTEIQMPIFSCGGMRYRFLNQDIPKRFIPASSQNNVEATIRRALDLGITHIETARDYGTSEIQLGEVLKQFPQDDLIVQTKGFPQADPNRFLRVFEQSLQNLQLDYIDLFAIHGINTQELMDQTLRPGGCLEVAQALRKKGKIRCIGFSTHAPTALIKRLILTSQFDYVNLHWYYINQDNWSAIELANAHDMGVFIISPTDKGGQLYNPPQKLVDLCAPLSPMVFNDLFCLSHPQVHTLSVGASNPEDFDEHLKVLPLLEQSQTFLTPIVQRLQDAEIERLGKTWVQTWRQGVPSYDQTPKGINIPVILWLHNLLEAYDMKDFAKARYNLLGNGSHWFPGQNAAQVNTINLQDCLANSPHAAIIPELLEQTHQRLQGKKVRRFSQQGLRGLIFLPLKAATAFNLRSNTLQSRQNLSWSTLQAPQRGTKTIVFINAWHDQNRGDSGLYDGMLTLFQRQWPNAKLGLVSMFGQSDPNFASAHSHLQQQFPALVITPAPFLTHAENVGQGRFQKLWNLFVLLTSLLLPNTILTRKSKAIQLMQSADLVVSVGGQYFNTDSHSLKSLAVIFRLAYPLLMAQKKGIPYLFFSQSFSLEGIQAERLGGNQSYPQRLDHQLLRWVMNRAIAVWTREPQSYQRILNLGVPKNNVTVVPDAVLALPQDRSPGILNYLRVNSLGSKSFWIVTVKQQGTLTNKFLDEMALLVPLLLQQQRVEKVLMVPHSLGPTEADNDLIAAQALIARLESNCRGDVRRPQDIIVTEQNFSPRELSVVYQEAQFVIGTRFQSVLLALSVGTPVYAIAYAPSKTQGIMQQFGLSHLCTSLEQFNANEVIEQLRSLDIDQLAVQIKEQAEQDRNQLDNAVQNLGIGLPT
jgi:uncharacterized protein